MDAFKFTVEVSIPKQAVQDLLVCAFEGGSNYWYAQLEPLKETIKTGHASDQFYGNMMKHGFRLVDKETDETHEVLPAKFETALRLMQSKFPVGFQSILEENTDASDGDVFLQLLVHGDVIYG